MIKKCIVLFVFILISIACTKTPDPWLIIPNDRAGLVKAGATEEDLKKLFGSDAVKYTLIHLEEGVSDQGPSLFLDDPSRKISFLTSEDAKIVGFVIFGDKTLWHFSNGVTLGTTLQELEKLNGRPFTLSGWGWDYSGIVLNWNGGNLETSLPLHTVRIQLNPEAGSQSVLTPDEDLHLTGDTDHLSNETALTKLNPKINHIGAELTKQ